ncbi:PREDICTED: oxysterol-binding protein-related protein 10, partial [Crocodylus porosus]|uniref:oxysterol-binding protein-related protein 10 n=1 Tax=Crocodylus porosus TaxID=8502 RepID=UPI00093DF2B0
RLEGGSGSSPSSAAASPAGSGRRREPVLEGALSKYTNLLQGWQSRYFVLDFETGILQYFVNEQSKNQKPRGAVSLAGAIISPSDEAPHMLVVYSANGEMYKLRAADAKEKQYWVTQLRSCAKYHTEGNSKSNSSRNRSFSLLPHGTTNSASPSSQKHLSQSGPTVVTITHHKSPAAARRAKSQQSGQMHEVREEHQQQEAINLIQYTPTNTTNARSKYTFSEPTKYSKLQESLRPRKKNEEQMSSLDLPGHSPEHISSARAHFLSRDKLLCLYNKSCFLDLNIVDSVLWPLSNWYASFLTQYGRCCYVGQCLKSLYITTVVSALSTVLVVRFNSSFLFTENILGWHGPKSHSTDELKNGALSSLSSASASLTWAIVPTAMQDGQALQLNNENSTPELIPVEDEMTDTEDNEEEDLGVMDEQRSVILHLISQLKLGMDLTRVVLPTFILEKRSLLEMYANFMAHPDLFLSIAAGATPEERIICFVEYYLTAFHEGRKGAVAKKPYNPIIGEMFHCSWDVPKDKVKPFRTNSASAVSKDQTKEFSQDQSECYKLRFVAEQVSHHPPVSCFYCECKEKKMCVNAHVWTKSKFMGMSIGVSMVGEVFAILGRVMLLQTCCFGSAKWRAKGVRKRISLVSQECLCNSSVIEQSVLYLMDHEEEYVFTLPSAYARSILTIPWVELGGKVSINCAKTGYSATVTFHTKPFYGGKVHRVTAEVKHNPTGTIVCKAQGEWNGMLEFTYSNGETKVIDTTKLPVIRKKIRPIVKQGPLESRHLWQHVTSCLKEGNIDAATEHKHRLEERQRVEEGQRVAINALWKPKYFTREGDGWIYFNPLWKAY